MATNEAKVENPTDVVTAVAENERTLTPQATATNIEITENILGTRPRKQTAKGQEYQVDLLTRRYKSTSKRLSRQCTLMDDILETSDADLILQELANIDKLFAEVEEFNTRLLDILPEEEQGEQLTYHEEIDGLVFETKRKSCQWIKQNEEPSVRSRSRRSHASSRSGSRSNSRASSRGSHAGSEKSLNSKLSRVSTKLESLKLEESALQQVQKAKQKELQCKLNLETAKMETQRTRLQQKIIKTELEENAKLQSAPTENPPSLLILNQPAPSVMVHQAQLSHPLKQAKPQEQQLQPPTQYQPHQKQSQSLQHPPHSQQALQPLPDQQISSALNPLAPAHQPQLLQSLQAKSQQQQLQPLTQHQPHQKQSQVLQHPPHSQQAPQRLPDQQISSALNPLAPPPMTNQLSSSRIPNQPASTSMIDQSSSLQSLENIQLQQCQPELQHQQMQKHGAYSQHHPNHYHPLENQQTNMMNVMLKLVDLHTAPDVDINVFSGDPLEYGFFRATFHDVVERKVTDPRGRLTRLFKYTTGDAKDLIKHCIHEEESNCFDKAISLLDKEYGNKQLLVTLYLNKLRQWPQVPLNDASAYKKLHRFLLTGLTYKRDGKLVELDSETVIRTCILAKMDRSVQNKWLSKVVREREKGEAELKFSDLVKFIDHLSLLASEPSYSQSVYNNDTSSNLKSYGASVQLPLEPPTLPSILKEAKNNGVTGQPPRCLMCDGEHRLETCLEFKELKVWERARFIFQNRLCFNCFEEVSDTHLAKTCTKKYTCQTCKASHPTLMHGLNKAMKCSTIHSPSDGTISMCIVPVRISHENNKQTELEVYALLDENCQGTFILESVAERLSATKRPTCITTETINGSKTDTSFAVNGLIVKALPNFENEYGASTITLPTTYTREMLTCHGEEVPTPQKIENWPHLQDISTRIPAYNTSIPLALIIGANCPKILEPQEVIPSSECGPYASRSLLGWRVVGPIGGKVDSLKCFRVGMRISSFDAAENVSSNHHFTLATPVKDTSLTQSLQDMYKHDFPEESSEKVALSNEDLIFMAMMKDSIKKAGEHYQLPLPFRDPSVNMPNNRDQAVCRLRSIKKKLMRDSTYRKDYCAFMKSLLDKGYAIRSKDSPQGKTWYLPHHGVRHPVKGKLRVVFDCSARYKNFCLNDELLQGPDLTNLMVGVLLRFRHGYIGYTADIEAMYYQVQVPEEQQTFLKFLWWPNGDPRQVPQDYQMRVHLFGAVSSPSCANFALRQTVVENKSQNTTAGKAILDHFYVDDMLNSNDEADIAIETISTVQKLCASGGFNLTKFVCKNPAVMESIPINKRSVELVREISKTETIERALGVSWCLETDTLGFRIALHDTPLTRRGILSTVSSIYDPLGLAGPFLLKGRKILQKITSLTDGWDSQVPDDLAMAWTHWRNKLTSLQEIFLQRCYKPCEFGQVKTSSLHLFSDASEIGYGVAAYLRQVNVYNVVNVSLVFGKSRVAPLKSVTIPRLELTAATVSAKLGAMLTEELKIPNLLDLYWSDSMITLGYIQNDVKRFRVFVSNRVQKIRSSTKKEQWCYVDTKENPADHASRGLSVEDVDAVSQWFQGPDFLWREDQWKNQASLDPLPNDDPEIRRPISVQASMVTESSYVITKLEERLSSWKRATRVIATMLKFHRRCKQKKEITTTLSVEDIQEAELIIIKLIQEKHMSKEIKNISQPAHTAKLIKKNLAHIWKLDPFLDDKGILRVGGRLKRATALLDTEKHPAILPNKSVMARRIAEHFHKQVKHLGRTSTLNEIRYNGYWLVGANTTVRSIIHHCVPCKLLRGRLGGQKMADLPPERFTTEGPFTFTGLDMFGPFYIKDGRKENKRFVALFTCLSSRAVHLESTIKIDTDSFIQALRRFIARRGSVREILSDNGKNFVGTANEWKKAFKEMDQSKIGDFLLSHSCDWINWKRNPPSASHMGGVWERQIRSVRSVLSALFMEHSKSLNDESFRTLLTEAECIVNSVPLTVESLSDPESLPLCPINLLTLKTKVVLPPPGAFQKNDLYCRRRWRQVQHLANEFWTRWRKEYLSNLQTRQKWINKEPNFQVNDIVLVKDEDLPRNQWPLARVIKISPDKSDGLVRSVQLHVPTSKSNLTRPIHKLLLLVDGSATE